MLNFLITTSLDIIFRKSCSNSCLGLQFKFENNFLRCSFKLYLQIQNLQCSWHNFKSLFINGYVSHTTTHIHLKK